MSITVGHILSRLQYSSYINQNKDALVYNNERITYKELDNRVNSIAQNFTKLGFTKGDSVALLLYNCHQFLECFFALSKLGIRVVPMNFRLVKREIEYILKDSRTKCLIFGEEFSDTIAEIRIVLPEIDRYICVGNNNPDYAMSFNTLYHEQTGEPLLDDRPTLDDDHLLMYTSGTTGTPKGALYSHGNTLWSAMAQTIDFKITREDVNLIVGPLYHVGPLHDFTISTFHQGGTNVIMPSTGFDIESMLQIIEQERISVALIFPVILRMLIENEKLIEKYDISSLRMIMTGGELISTSTIESILRTIPNADFVQIYGQTEAGPCVTYLQSEDALSKAGSIGKPSSNMEVCIIDKQGDMTKPGEVGEIVVRSPATIEQYWFKPDATKETITSDRWLYTGDLAYLDNDGYIYLSGRKKDMIISGAENIYPVEIENVLYTHENILETAVIGVPDKKWGEAVVAVIVPKDGEKMEENDVVEFCKKNLASYKKPKYVEFIEGALPRNPSGKVLKYKLKEEFGKKYSGA